MRFSPRARLLLLCALGLLVAGAGPPEFRGCGDDGPPDVDVPLPLADGGSCLRDEDCPADECMDVRCLAGACMAVAPRIDRDGDGHAPAPCGDDCDDGDPTSFGGALEVCDGRDNDCDGAVDDGAPRRDTTYGFPQGDPASLVLGWGPELLFTERTTVALWGIPVGLDGSSRSTVEIMRLSMGSAFARVAGATASDGRVLILSVTDFGAARYAIFDPTSGTTLVEGPSSMPLPTDLTTVETIEVIPFGSGWAIAYDGATATGSVRVATVDPAVEPTIRLPLVAATTEAFGFATDGTHIVLTDSEDQLVFFRPDGTEAGRHTVAGLTGRRHLASFAGSVVVVTPDGFDFTLGHVDLTTGLGETFPAPFGDADDTITLGTAADLVLVGRTNPRAGTTVQALLGDLLTYEGSPIALPSTDTASRVSFSATGNTVAVGGARSAGFDLALLRACGM